MKRTFLKTLSKRFIAAAFLSSVIIMHANASEKIPGIANIKVVETLPIGEITYAGNEGNMLSFNLKFENITGEKFTITIKDENGDVLFAGVYNEKTFAKKFKFVNGASYGKLNFSIYTEGSSLEETFVVNTVQKTIDEVTVTKL